MALDEQTSETSTPAGSAGIGDASSTRSRNRSASSFGAGATNLSSHLDSEEQFIPDPTKPIRGGYIAHLDVVYVGGAPIQSLPIPIFSTFLKEDNLVGVQVNFEIDEIWVHIWLQYVANLIPWVG